MLTQFHLRVINTTTSTSCLFHTARHLFAFLCTFNHPYTTPPSRKKNSTLSPYYSRARHFHSRINKRENPVSLELPYRVVLNFSFPFCITKQIIRLAFCVYMCVYNIQSDAVISTFFFLFII